MITLYLSQKIELFSWMNGEKQNTLKTCLCVLLDVFASVAVIVTQLSSFIFNYVVVFPLKMKLRIKNINKPVCNVSNVVIIRSA